MERNFLLLIIFFVTNLFGGDVFWFSYRSVTANKALIFEQKNISPVMVNLSAKKTPLFTCKVKLKKDTKETVLNILNKNFYKILPCFYKVAVKVTAMSTNTTYNLKDEVEMIITPTKFIVDFKDDFANITILK